MKKLLPELYTHKDVMEACQDVWEECFEKSCDECPHKNELGEEMCKTDLICELWRRIRNLEAEADVRQAEWEEFSVAKGYVRCSHCRNVYIPQEWITETKWKYCPGCGYRFKQPKIN